jgi:hypothetical protein
VGAVLDMVKSNGLNGRALRDKVKDTLADDDSDGVGVIGGQRRTTKQIVVTKSPSSRRRAF